MRSPRLAVILLSTALPLAAFTNGESEWQLIVQEDNDLLTGTDNGYTNGTRIALSRELDRNGANFNRLQRFLQSITDAEHDIPLNSLRAQSGSIQNIQWGIGLSQLMFTADNPNALTPPDGERPYAGWLGLELSLQASSSRSANAATISIGITGEDSFAGDAQTWWHENVSDSPEFLGWDSQAPTELTINLHLDHKTRWQPGVDGALPLPLEVDGFYEWGASLGNFRTDAYIGALVRIGINLPASYTTPRLQLGSFNNTIFDEQSEPTHKPSLYGFVGIRGYAVLHDITLDGPLFSEWDESVDSQPFVGEFNYGIASGWKFFEVSLAHTIRTDEFEDQRNRSRYGSVVVRLSCNY